MYKQIMLLGLLLARPMYGQQIREVIENHHDLFANHIKKPTIYYQLERMASEGYLEIRHEAVDAPGPGAAHDARALRERDIYYITERGRVHFSQQLRSMLSSYTPALDEVEACLYFLHHLTPAEGRDLLTERLALISAYRASIQAQPGLSDAPHQLVNEHKLALLDAEIQWLLKTIAYLAQSPTLSIHHTAHTP